MKKQTEQFLEKNFNFWEKRNVDFKDEQYVFKYGEDVFDAYKAGYSLFEKLVKKQLHDIDQDLMIEKSEIKQKMLRSNKKLLEKLL